MMNSPTKNPAAVALGSQGGKAKSAAKAAAAAKNGAKPVKAGSRPRGRPPALNAAQLDGCACVVCGESHRPMIVIPDVETRSSTHLFRCNRSECAVGVEQVRARIPVAQRMP